VNTLRVVTLACLAFFSMLATASATDGQGHGSHGHEKTAKMDHHNEMKHDDQAGTTAGCSMVILGSTVNKGVKGMAHLSDVSAISAKMGLATTHHFMIALVDEATGLQIETGRVALKVTNPDAKVGETIELVGMGGHFGADVVLDMQGEYHFKIGTKLADGVSRKYHFHYVVQ
jgi:hypothetical protein